MERFKSSLSAIFVLLIIGLILEGIARYWSGGFIIIVSVVVIYLVYKLIQYCRNKRVPTVEKALGIIATISVVAVVVLVSVLLLKPDIFTINPAIGELSKNIKYVAVMYGVVLFVVIIAFSISNILGLVFLALGCVISFSDIIKMFQATPPAILIVSGLMLVVCARSIIKMIKKPIATSTEETPHAAEYEAGERMSKDERIDIDSMSGPDFERFCADLLRIHGYTDIYLTPASGDHGIDITAEKDSLKWGFQCKRWSDTKVDNTTVAQTYTGKALYDCDIVAIITTSGFTRQAESEAKQLGVKLWGRNRVKELMRKLEDRERYYFSRVA